MGCFDGEFQPRNQCKSTENVRIFSVVLRNQRLAGSNKTWALT